ncbi:MAG: ABC transporter ATP-binding protein [Dehalococcoidia bacterium]
MILEVDRISTYYGLSQVLFDLSLAVEEGEVVALLGRNGAGKTTTLRSIMGLTPPRGGSIRFKGEAIAGKQPYAVARRGIAFVPEDRRIFPDLTVRENLDVARRKSKDGRDGWTVKRVYSLFTDLEKLDGHRGGHLSGGEQQMLTIARALVGNPQLLLLDEPSEGLAPLVVQRLSEQLRLLRDEGMTILLSEQNLRFALNLSDRAYVIDKGEIRFEGSAEALEQDEKTRSAYLGL